MGWEPAAGIDVDSAQARSAGEQAATYLIAGVHAEVDEAQIGPIQVLMDAGSPGKAVYAAATVVGPLRSYLATAWGRAGHVSGKQIVAHSSPEEAQAALEALVRQRLGGQGSPHTYRILGVFRPEPDRKEGA